LEQYISAARDAINMLKSYVKYLGSKEREETGSLIPPDPEAWFFRGGVIGQMERLVPTCNDFKSTVSTNQIQVIRPYTKDDLEEIYKLCNKNLLPVEDYLRNNEKHQDAFDRSLGAFADFEQCTASFVLEIDDEIRGVIFGHSEAKTFYTHQSKHWLPKMLSKYSKREENPFSKQPWGVDEKTLERYPGVVCMKIDSVLMGTPIVKKLLNCVLNVLKTNIHFVMENISCKEKEQFKDLGFTTKDMKHKDSTIFLYQR